MKYFFSGLPALLLVAFLSLNGVSHAQENADKAQKKRKPVSRKTPLKQPVKHTPARQKIPGISNQPPSEDPLKNSTSQAIEIDKDLKIVVPTKARGGSETFLYDAYSQKFMADITRLLHVVIPDIEDELIKIRFRKTTFLKNVRLFLQTAHFQNLLKEHPVVRLRRNALDPIKRFKDKILTQIVVEVQSKPNENLKELKSFLQEFQFEDIYAGQELYISILNHIMGENLLAGKDAYQWFENQAEDYGNPDSQFTYKTYLNRRPEKIRDDFVRYLQVLLFENVDELILVSSRTYLEESQKLTEALKLLRPDPAVVRKLDLQLEFLRLTFEPFEKHSAIYENLMGIFPKIPGSKVHFENDYSKARLFFPFFDQLTNYADRRFERGRYACQEALAFDQDSCLQHWREATQVYRYVARFAPFSILVRNSLERLQEIQKNKVIDYPFISRSELLELIDESSRPFL